MYLDHFGLNREPFHITPDPYFFYLGPSHKESLASLIYGLKNRKGFISLTGEVGLGKTTVIRAFLKRWSTKAKIKTVFVFNPNLSFKGLLLTIFAELDRQPPEEKNAENSYALSSEQDQIFELVQTLHRALIHEFEQGYNVILVIDEAQNMPLQTLENLRMLSNLETSRDKLLQIFLVGQTELDRRLDRRELRQLRQRIAIRATLRHLTKKQSKEYILHRLDKAGAHRKIFTRGALQKICKYSYGIPRKINILADNALITGFGYGQATIGSKIIKEVHKDLQGKASRNIRSFALASVVLLALLATTIWLSPYRSKLLAGLQDIAPWSSTISVFQQAQNAQQRTPALEAVPESKSGMQPNVQSLPQKMQSNAHHSTLKQAGTGEKTAAEKDHSAQLKQKNQPKVDQQALQDLREPGFADGAADFPLPLSEQTEENVIIHNQLADKIPSYSRLSSARQLVLIRMAKQTSIKGLLTFERMLAALDRGDYQEAAREILSSHWARSVGEEAEALADSMRKGNE